MREAAESGKELVYDYSVRLIREWVRRRSRAIAAFFEAIWPYLVLFGVLYLVTSTLFYLLERFVGGANYSWQTSLYWAIDTFGGGAFQAVPPTIPATQTLGSIMVIMTIFLLALVINAFGRRAEDVGRRDSLGLLGTSMTDHYLVVGSGAVARAAIRDLLKQGLKVGVVAQKEGDVPTLRPMAPSEQLYLTVGPPSEPETLTRLNVARAHAAIIATDDDALSAIVALIVRSQAPKARIVVAINRPELRSTIRAAGVTFVASPLEMGGRICASAAFEPEVASALDELTTVAVGSELQEYVLPPTAPIVNRSFHEALSATREHTDCILVGFARKDNGGVFQTVLAPSGGEVLLAGDAVILVGNQDKTTRFREWLGAPQGR